MSSMMSTSTPTPSFTSLHIRFIVEKANPESDDWVNVVPIYSLNATASSQEYKITAKLGKKMSVSKVYGGYNLVEYITNLLRLVSADDLPCEQLQFDIPNVPSILVYHNRIRNRIPEVADMLLQLVESWPQVGTELPVAQPFANINWNATATPFASQSHANITIPAPPFNWNSSSFRTPRRVNRHMYFDDAGNEVINLTMDSDSE